MGVLVRVCSAEFGREHIDTLDMSLTFTGRAYLKCSDPSGPVNPVNSCTFVAVLYFFVFRLWSCIFLYFYLLLSSVAFIRLLLKYSMYSPLKDIYTSWFLSAVAECGMLRNT